jgi:outer membrane protein TolC
MCPVRFLSRVVLCASLVAALHVDAFAQASALPSPLTIGDVARLASERRDEIAAARARRHAADERPAIVGALDDPMLSPSLDHAPFMGGGADFSVTIEQQFPLSKIRQHRRDAANADILRRRAEVSQAHLDVRAEAINSFLMLHERRRMQGLIDEQLSFARDVVVAANARYASAVAPQSDVLRAELELARLRARARSVVGEVRSAEAMLNASLAIDVDQPVPPLTALDVARPLPSMGDVTGRVRLRPELEAARADVARADADILVMRDMYRPMATVRTGPAYTMAEGRGWMAMVGVSLPIRRDKLRAGVAEAEAMKSMAEADVRAMTRMFEGEGAAALGQLEAAHERQVAVATDVLPRARMAIQPAIAGYAAGQLPLVSVIEAVQALWFVQADAIAADTEVGLAWVRFGRAIGSLEGIAP